DNGCGGKISGLSGHIDFPVKKEQFSNYSHCVWTITTTPNALIETEFSDVGFQYNEVMVREGNSSTKGERLWYSYGYSSSYKKTDNQNQIIIIYSTRRTSFDGGFVLNWEKSNECGYTYTWDSYIKYPNQYYYPENAHCIWRISSPLNTVIKLELLKFDLALGDHLII
ncbi:unnamed protein product, partial [Meganyctiphanes norvegica]